MKKTLLFTFVLSFIFLGTAEAKYLYRHTESEYSVLLPDAPSGTTIWADQASSVPYLTKPPRFGDIGETAIYHRVDSKTGEFMDIKITFLKADRDFLLTRNDANIQADVEKTMGSVLLEDKKFAVSKGEDTIKWATMTGFSVDKQNRALYNAVHYLTGRSTLMVIKVQYSVENDKLNTQYQDLVGSIKLAQ